MEFEESIPRDENGYYDASSVMLMRGGGDRNAKRNNTPKQRRLAVQPELEPFSPARLLKKV